MDNVENDVNLEGIDAYLKYLDESSFAIHERLNEVKQQIPTLAIKIIQSEQEITLLKHRISLISHSDGENEKKDLNQKLKRSEHVYDKLQGSLLALSDEKTRCDEALASINNLMYPQAKQEKQRIQNILKSNK